MCLLPGPLPHLRRSPRHWAAEVMCHAMHGGMAVSGVRLPRREHFGFSFTECRWDWLVCFLPTFPLVFAASVQECGRVRASGPIWRVGLSLAPASGICQSRILVGEGGRSALVDAGDGSREMEHDPISCRAKYHRLPPPCVSTRPKMNHLLEDQAF